MALNKPWGQISWAKASGRSSVLLFWRKRHAEVEARLAKDLRVAIRRAMLEMKRKIIPLVTGGSRSTAAIDSIVAQVHFGQIIRKAAEPEIVKAVTTGALDEFALHLPRKHSRRFWVKRIAPEHIKLPPVVKRRVDEYAQEILRQPYWTDLSDTMREEIAEAIRESQHEGTSNDELAADLNELMGEERSDTRGKLIARTEVTGSLNGGQQAARQQLYADGLIKGKEWLAILDMVTRDDHEEANGQQKKVDEPFVVGGEECDTPGDFSLSAGNRCN